jgi:hypothetical protein
MVLEYSLTSRADFLSVSLQAFQNRGRIRGVDI